MADFFEKSIRIGIHQPGYHRYCGYFYKMLKSDLFISLDTVQYVTREWQNRQLFYQKGKQKWLSVPVNAGREPIKDKRLVNLKTLKEHWEYLKNVYSVCPYFNEYSQQLEYIYSRNWEYLNDFCDTLTLLAKDILGITTTYVRDSANAYIDNNLHKADALIDAIRRSIKISDYENVIYLPRNYPIPEDFYLNQAFNGNNTTEIEKFQLAGIQVQTYDFHHPMYEQFQNKLGTPFIPNMSIFDLIFNHGKDSLAILKSGGNDEYRT